MVSSMAIVLQLNKRRRGCRKKFLYYFPAGFRDQTYLEWERNYKSTAHEAWMDQLNKDDYHQLLENGQYEEIARMAIKIETKTNLLFSFEKMALRDAVKEAGAAKLFAEGLYQYIYGSASLEKRFIDWAAVLSALPVKQTRVHTWPLQTVFGFIANPREHFFLKPRVTQAAAIAYDYNFEYRSKPNFETYQSVLNFANLVRKDQSDLKPKDMIDLQSFIWVMGSAEYP